MKDIVLPESVAGIGEYAFQYCKSLISINIPNSVKYIRKYTFSDCEGLKSISIPNSVTTIETNAFSNCTALTSISIGNGVTKINSLAFSNCKNLETVTSYATTVPTTYSSAFLDSYIDYATLFVPEEAVQSYKSNAPWSKFGTIKTLSGSSVETKKCAKPSIAYEDGKLYFSTATPNATICHTITCSDAKFSEGTVLDLAATYTITAYSTRSGYDDSDKTTATLVWASATLSNDASSVKAIKVDSTPLLISQDGGTITVCGVAEGETITAYSTSGMKVATSMISGSNATLNLSELQGQIAILKVGDKSAKVMIK